MKKIILVILALSIYGCATYTTTTKGTLIHENMVSEIVTGETTKEWIIDLLGPPNEQSIEGDKEKLTYIYTEKSVPSYLFGVVRDEANAIVTKDILEIIIKDELVYSYKYKSRVK